MKHFIFLLLTITWSTAAINAQDLSIDTLGEELIITDSKISKSIKSATRPNIIITKEQINQVVQNDLSVVLDQQLGIQALSSLSNHATNKSIFLQGAGGEYALILIDGVPISDPSGIGGTFDIRVINKNDIERIEVVKGGLSTLYGSDAVAGVINFITKKEAKKGTSGYFGAAIGTYATRDINAGIKSALSDAISLNINGATSGSNSASGAISSDPAVTFENDGFSRKNLAASLDIFPSKSVTISPFFRWSDYDGDYDDGAFTDGINLFETSWSQYGIDLGIETGKHFIKANASHNVTERTFNSAAFGASTFEGVFTNVDIWDRIRTSDKVNVLVGFNAQSFETPDQINDEAPSSGIISPYASINYTPNEKSALDLALRLNNHDDFGSNFNYTIGASHWFSNNVKLLGSFATSFKAPNLFQLFGQFGANPELNPQKGASLNVALQVKAGDILDHFEIGLFSRRINELIIFDFTLGCQNASEIDSRGVELAIGKRFGKVNIGAQYAFVKNELNGVTNMLRIPPHQIDMNIDYSISPKANVGLRLRNVSERDDAYFDNATFEVIPVTLESYLYGALTGTYKVSDQLVFAASIRNLFDTEFQEIAGFSTLGRNFNLSGRLEF